MAQCLFIRGARQLLTLRGPTDIRRGYGLRDLGIIPDGSILIDGDRIQAVGPTRRIENLKDSRSALEIPADGMVVMPGFVDPNIRLEVYSTAALQSPTRKRHRIIDFYNEVLAFMRSCLQYGTLNIQVKAASGLAELSPDMAVLRQLVKLGNSPIGMSRCWRLGASSRLASQENPGNSEFQEILATIESHGLAHSVELETSGEPNACNIIFPALDQSSLDFDLFWPGGPSELLQALLTRSRIRAVFTRHNLSEHECQALSDSDSIAVFSLGHALDEDHTNNSLRKLIERGGAIAISSGYDGSSTPTFSMQTVLTLAQFRLGLTPEEAITAATVNAAYAIHRGAEIGTLEVGKKADLIALNVPDFRDISRGFGTNHVGMAIREGIIAFNRTRWKGAF